MVDSRENEDSTLAHDIMLLHQIDNLNRRVLQYQENDTINDTVNSQNYTVNELKEGLKMIYKASQNHPDITHSQISEFFNISESTSKRATRDLKKLRYIERKDSDKIGKRIMLK